MADYRNLGDHRVLRFREKGGKDREIPVRHELAAWLNEYIAAAGSPRNPRLPSSAPLTANASISRCCLHRPLHALDDEAAAGRCRIAVPVRAA
ncbi:MAG: hypothetical protein JO166_05250 [Deltaproteobacteria bacterium]|nr:hypothetical protein [Deltaproteobacteria bacterium]